MIKNPSPAPFGFRQFSRILPVLSAASLFVAPYGNAAVIVMIDDYNTGSVNMTSQDSMGVIQTEPSLPPSSVIAGNRRTEFTSTIASASYPGPATLTSGGGLITLAGPGGRYNNYVTFSYNAGQGSFPSTGLGFDGSTVEHFIVDMAQLAGPVTFQGMSIQIQLLNTMGNSSSTSKGVFSAGPVTFLPSEFTSGVWPTVHTIRLNISYGMRPEYTQSMQIDSFHMQTIPEPGSIGLLCGGLLMTFTRRRHRL